MSPSSAPAAARRHLRLCLCPRARGLCAELNLNPVGPGDGAGPAGCRPPRSPPPVPLGALQHELEQVLAQFAATDDSAAAEWRTLRQVLFTGDGEPTDCPNFIEVIEVVAHQRALQRTPFFKLVLLTHGVGLNRPAVRRGLRLFCADDEIWVRVDPDSTPWLPLPNAPGPLRELERNVAELASRRAIVIQSVFRSQRGGGPARPELRAYTNRLRALIAAGARIRQVQICSTLSPGTPAGRDHLPLRTLSEIARFVRTETGLCVEVY